MKTNTILLIAALALLAYFVYTEASANPQAFKPAAPSTPNVPRTFWQSINDASYNILFGWWLK